MKTNFYLVDLNVFKLYANFFTPHQPVLLYMYNALKSEKLQSDLNFNILLEI